MRGTYNQKNREQILMAYHTFPIYATVTDCRIVTKLS